MTNPVYAYSHAESGCARDHRRRLRARTAIWPSAYDGTYLYGDYTCGKIFVLTPNGSGGFTRSEFADDVGAVVNMTFGPSPQGQGLYYTNYTNGGEVRRIESTASRNRPPTARVTATPDLRRAAARRELRREREHRSRTRVTRSRYIWNFGDGSPVATTASATTSHTYTTAGTFTATLTVRDNHGAASPAAQARIDPGNTAPQVTIDTPTVGDRFAVGQTITMHATATDAEDGTLPASRLSWRRAPPPRRAHASVPRADGRERRPDHAAGSRGSRLRDRRLPRDPADGDRFARGDDHGDPGRPAE